MDGEIIRETTGKCAKCGKRFRIQASKRGAERIFCFTCRTNAKALNDPEFIGKIETVFKDFVDETKKD